MTTAPHLDRTDGPTVTVLVDTFPDDVPLGRLVGSTGPTGASRLGIDVEGRIGADNGAARLRPLARPGWGREGLAWGPVERMAGVAFSAHLLNGHHASQTYYPPETAREMARRWAGQLARRDWRPRPRHHESLAVGLFDSDRPTDPLRQGHGLVVHSATEENGELWAGAAGSPLRMLRGLQNLPLAVVVLLRERGAAYYAATIEDDPDLPALPLLRPLAIDPEGTQRLVYPGVHQRILGEVGYRVDSRLYRAEVAFLPSLATWYGTAIVADRLTGHGALDGSVPVRGGTWRSVTGALTRGSRGSNPGRTPAAAIVDAGEPLGLVHARVRLLNRRGEAGVLVRSDATGASCWRAVLTRRQARLELITPEGTEMIASAPIRSAGRDERSLQVLDDGRTLGVHLDGQLLFTGYVGDPRLAGATHVGLYATDACVRDIEAHPRTVLAPLAAEAAWPQLAEPGSARFDECFDSDGAGPMDLDGRATPSGGRRWERTLGVGHLDLVPKGLRVRADVAAPNPGRTIYSVPWDEPDFIDVTVSMVPAGRRRGEGHRCRTGLALWEDAENFVIVNVWLDDHFPGTSVSTFYRVNGHEDMYDAVWTLTGSRVDWGRSLNVRVVFDGQRFVASVDGRPALYRAIRDVYADAPDLQVRRLGLVANEEWGDDTGSVFTRVVAAGRGDR